MMMVVCNDGSYDTYVVYIYITAKLKTYGVFYDIICITPICHL